MRAVIDPGVYGGMSRRIFFLLFFTAGCGRVGVSISVYISYFCIITENRRIQIENSGTRRVNPVIISPTPFGLFCSHGHTFMDMSLVSLSFPVSF